MVPISSRAHKEKARLPTTQRKALADQAAADAAAQAQAEAAAQPAAPQSQSSDYSLRLWRRRL